MTLKQRPIIAGTMGDAAGVGPEVIVKALLSEEIYTICRPLLVGESVTMSKAIKLLDSPLKLRPIKTLGEVKGDFGTIDLIDLHNLDQKEVILGQICRACGKAAMEYIA